MFFNLWKNWVKISYESFSEQKKSCACMFSKSIIIIHRYKEKFQKPTQSAFGSLVIYNNVLRKHACSLIITWTCMDICFVNVGKNISFCLPPSNVHINLILFFVMLLFTWYEIVLLNMKTCWYIINYIRITAKSIIMISIYAGKDHLR